MAFRDFLPFQQAPSTSPKKAALILPVDDQRALAKTFKVAALAIGFNGLPNSMNSRAVFETPEIDLDRIGEAIDTDSYVRQGINKYRELIWKEGWEIVSENERAASYVWQRIDFMEIAMNRSFDDFLAEVADQLVRYANVFIVKSRGDLAPYFPGKLYPPEGRNPIVGYYLIPTEQVEILRDRHNKPKWYRQRREDSYMSGSRKSDPDPKWNAKDVIHLYFDRKPGRAFGTPFLATALDDVIALRQVEEDIQNLVHRELFPLYKYKIGTDDHPSTQDEVDNAIVELEGLRTEGGLVMPHRHDVEVIGADGAALDAAPYVAHMKERVAIALGLFPHHLGMTGSGANKAMTDRLDTALYDKVKTYQKYIANEIRRSIFDELLAEGGFDPYVHPSEVGESDRCVFKFREIDVDTQVKKETHAIQKYVQGATTLPELRIELGYDPDIDEAETAAAYAARMAPPAVEKPPAGSTSTQPKVIDVTPKPAQKALPSGSGKKGPNNIIRPTNQYGTKTSPNIRRSDVDLNWLKEVEDLLGDAIIDIEE